MIRIAQVRAELDYEKKPLVLLAAKALKVKPEDVLSARIVKKSVDARDKGDVHFSLTLDVETARPLRHLPRGAQEVEEKQPRPLPEPRRLAHRPLVVGLGPAGLFAGLRLAQAGLKPVVIERGKCVEDREKDVETFWKGGAFNPMSNVQFGEGGAGAFSDGKLTTGIKDPRCREVLETLHRAGAPEEILYLSKPHIGTDNLKKVVRNIREEIKALGGDVRFETKLERLIVTDGRVTGAALVSGGNEEILETDDVILAVGHSARDTFYMLHDLSVPMHRKPFSIGARIEHKQDMINRSQYGAAAAHPALGAADYKLSVHLPNGRAVYTFCMCPGGQVVAAASYEPGVKWTELDPCLPGFAAESLRMALPMLDKKLRGFASEDAVFTGVETRSSSPVRIERDKGCMSELRGLYPCGEGAGYAGGILSAAVDGLRCADALMKTEE